MKKIKTLVLFCVLSLTFFGCGGTIGNVKKYSFCHLSKVGFRGKILQLATESHFITPKNSKYGTAGYLISKVDSNEFFIYIGGEDSLLFDCKLNRDYLKCANIVVVGIRMKSDPRIMLDDEIPWLDKRRYINEFERVFISKVEALESDL